MAVKWIWLMHPSAYITQIWASLFVSNSSLVCK